MADRADFVILREGLIIYCDAFAFDGEGRLLQYGKSVPQVFVLPAAGDGALTIDRALALADVSAVRNLAGDDTLRESRLLVRGVASSGNTGCSGWVRNWLSSAGVSEAQCRNLWSVENVADLTLAIDVADPNALPERVFYFEVVESKRPPLPRSRPRLGGKR